MPRQLRRKGNRSLLPNVSLENAVRADLLSNYPERSLYEQRELLIRLILVLEDGLNDEDIRRLLPGWEISHGV